VRNPETGDDFGFGVIVTLAIVAAFFGSLPFWAFDAEHSGRDPYVRMVPDLPATEKEGAPWRIVYEEGHEVE